MPELPEVETTMQGLIPHLSGTIIQEVIIRQPQLRWTIPPNLNELLALQKITKLSRRGKYLLIHLEHGTLIIHLGMSGSLQIVQASKTSTRHDHVDIILSDNKVLRYNDPRRFGAMLIAGIDPFQHPLLKHLGPEPMETDFSGDYLKKVAHKRRVAIKSFIMNSKVVTGVGNIYAAEALFLAKIHPLTEAQNLSQSQYDALAQAIKQVLQSAITQGGTTLRDFVNSDGKPGYFSQKLQVYGRAGLPCNSCGAVLHSIVIGQRSTVFCAQCQH